MGTDKPGGGETTAREGRMVEQADCPVYFESDVKHEADAGYTTVPQTGQRDDDISALHIKQEVGLTSTLPQHDEDMLGLDTTLPDERNDAASTRQSKKKGANGQNRSSTHSKSSCESTDRHDGGEFKVDMCDDERSGKASSVRRSRSGRLLKKRGWVYIESGRDDKDGVDNDSDIDNNPDKSDSDFDPGKGFKMKIQTKKQCTNKKAQRNGRSNVPETADATFPDGESTETCTSDHAEGGEELRPTPKKTQMVGIFI